MKLIKNMKSSMPNSSQKKMKKSKSIQLKKSFLKAKSKTLKV